MQHGSTSLNFEKGWQIMIHTSSAVSTSFAAPTNCFMNSSSPSEPSRDYHQRLNILLVLIAEQHQISVGGKMNSARPAAQISAAELRESRLLSSTTIHRNGTAPYGPMTPHFFSQIRYICSNPIMQQAREGASALSGAIGMDGALLQFSSKSKSGNAAKATADELMAPIGITNK